MVIQLQEITLIVVERVLECLFVCLFVHSSDVHVATASTINRAIGMG